MTLRKFVAPEFVFGTGAIRLAGQYAANLGARRVLLVSDPGVSSHSWLNRVRESLTEFGVDIREFTEVSANPRDVEVMAGAERYLREDCDAIVAIGGGSPMDCAKGIGIVCSNDRHILEFEGVDQVEVPGPPLICLPTTAGSSADLSQFAIISDTGRNVKVAIVSKTMVPDAALIDPQTTTTMDRDLTVHTGLDALTHAVESFVSNASSAITDLHALEAIRLISDGLPKVVEAPEDLALREQVMLGSLYAGLAFSNAILGAVHAMAHSLGGFRDLPHGLCNAILLDHVAAANFASAPERYCAIGRTLGASIDPAWPTEQKQAAAVGALTELKKRLGVTARLGELGVRSEDIAALAETACRDACMLTNPCELTPEEVCRIYELAL
jgi:alcohol dehydrogenase class IV